MFAPGPWVSYVSVSDAMVSQQPHHSAEINTFKLFKKTTLMTIQVHCSCVSPVSEASPRVCAVFEVRVDVLVTKDGEIEEAQAGAEEPGRRHHHQWYLDIHW